MNKEDQKEYAHINKEISITLHKMELIEARLTKEIWLDPLYPFHPYFTRMKTRSITT